MLFSKILGCGMALFTLAHSAALATRSSTPTNLNELVSAEVPTTTVSPTILTVKDSKLTGVNALNLAGAPVVTANHAVLGARGTKSTDKERLREAVKKWTTAGECSEGFFYYFDEQNAKAARYPHYYRNWKKSLKVQGGTTKRSNYGRFALHHWNGLHYDCKAELSSGCNQHLRCEDIVRATLDRNKGLSIEEGLKRSRTVYFATLVMELQNQELHSIMDSYNTVEANVLVDMDSLVRNFAQQVDKNADNICRYAKKTVDLWVGSMATIFGFGPMEDIPNQAGVFKFAVHIITELVNLALETEKKRVSGSGEAVNGLEVHLTPTYASGFCAGVGGGRTNDNIKHTIHLKEHIMRIFKDYRRVLFKISEVIAHEDRFDEWIDRQFWTTSSQVLSRQKHQFEEQSEEAIKGWALSAIWNGSQCYLKCEVAAHREDQCRGDGGAQARICPSANELCQAACWTTISRGNHEIELYGIKNLARYRLTIEKVMETSHRNFMSSGNTWAPPPLGEDFTFGNESAISLNTCRSSNVKITNFSNFKIGALSLPNDPLNVLDVKKAFPCSCGDWSGNDTGAFLDKMGLKFGPGNLRTKWQEALFRRTCPRQLEQLKMGPAERFLNYCALNIRWPDSKRWAYKLVLGERDARCASVQQKLEGMTSYQANRYFCTHMPERNAIFAQEKWWVDDFTPYPVSHSRMCDAWLAKSSADKTPEEFLIDGK